MWLTDFSYWPSELTLSCDNKSLVIQACPDHTKRILALEPRRSPRRGRGRQRPVIQMEWYTARWLLHELKTKRNAFSGLGKHAFWGTLNPETFESEEVCRVNDFLSNPTIFPLVNFWVCRRTKSRHYINHGLQTELETWDIWWKIQPIFCPLRILHGTF